MGHGPSNFKELDVKRALRAIESAGQKAASVVIEDGRIEIKLENSNGAADNNDNTNPWDKADL